MIVKLERRRNTQNLENVIVYLNSIVNVTIKSENIYNVKKSSMISGYDSD